MCMLKLAQTTKGLNVWPTYTISKNLIKFYNNVYIYIYIIWIFAFFLESSYVKKKIKEQSIVILMIKIQHTYLDAWAQTMYISINYVY